MMSDGQSKPAASPAISVVIPTYNRAKALISCLEHLERQTTNDFEVILVDDGSSDKTAEIVSEFLQRTSLNLRFVRQENSGPACARNHGISLARAPLTLMLGDDILGQPQLVESHVKLHQSHPQGQVAGLGLTLWDTEKQKVTRFMRYLESSQFAYDGLCAGASPTWEHFYTSNLSLKTSVLRQNPFCERFPSAAMEDIELGYRLSRAGLLKMIFLPEAVASHVHPTNFSQACRRMKSIGWSTHLFHELWPETYFNPKGSSPARRFLRGFIISSHLLGPATRFCGLLSLFCTTETIFQPVLNTYFYLGYQEGRAAMDSRGPGTRISRESTVQMS
jgi:glycosyltransferase involved in cell wall biosynthesis